MATHTHPLSDPGVEAPHRSKAFVAVRIPVRLIGIALLLWVAFSLLSFSSWSVDDPSLSFATDKQAQNWMGFPGAVFSDIWMQFFGLASLVVLLPLAAWGWALAFKRTPTSWPLRLGAFLGAALMSAGLLSVFAVPGSWPLPTGLGGLVGAGFSMLAANVLGAPLSGTTSFLVGLILLAPTLALLWIAMGLRTIAPFQAPPSEAETEDFANDPQKGDALGGAQDKTGFFDILFGALVHFALTARTAWRRASMSARQRRTEQADQSWRKEPSEPRFALNAQNTDDQNFERQEPSFEQEPSYGREPSFEQSPFSANDADFSPEEQADLEHRDFHEYSDGLSDPDAGNDHLARLSIEQANSPRTGAPVPAFVAPARVAMPAASVKPGRRIVAEAQSSFLQADGFQLPELSLLSPPRASSIHDEHRPEKLEARARQLEGVLEDFGVKGDIINVRPGPVVTLYELEPAPGIKSSRVISLADDIARSMSAVSARVAVVPGRNAIGIELPNSTRETVYLREMLASSDFEKVKGKLPICLGKTIGGEPIIADLARMPHLLIAGTTGSGKSVAVNTMILSLLYRMTPEQCRLIMIDPKMLELSIYDGIPHLLSPVVTDPTKAVVALKWAVREMEDRYRKMSKIGVRNIEGFNTKVRQANKKGETITRTVQTGFDRETGEAIYESESFQLEPLPYIVVIVDEMADLMMVAGKDIEGAIQRLAQMARAAGIHLIMATQRPSVDVITGTIKANFPTRISFQVTSKIDSRTILGEQGAEQLLGMGDMLYMAGGGRLKRLHGPFVDDREVEDVVAHLKEQGAPDYLESVTAEEEEFDDSTEVANSGNELYDKAVNIVLNDRKASTSYIQRRLSIGYNRAATLIEKMENEGIISPANHAGKREVLVGDGVDY
jgi:DNA segregation ATPase FtsK/SpoIIIE, S-DNA-T family